MDSASSRIFVKGLPPTFSEAEFKSHFSQVREITDAKIFPNRRIGYVGYKTPEDAQNAVKYFNKSFIRMSRIGVELAKSVQDAKNTKRQGGSAPTPRRSSGESREKGQDTGLKRKRGSETKEEKEDPKLKEFLDVMRPKNKKKAWEAEQADSAAGAQEGAFAGDDTTAAPNAANVSDDEYEDIPRKTKLGKLEEPPPEAQRTAAERIPANDEASAVPEQANSETLNPALSDADWARSRTSRLLGLLDDDDDNGDNNKVVGALKGDSTESDLENLAICSNAGHMAQQPDDQAVSSMPTPPSDNQKEGSAEPVKSAIDTVRESMRLFVRNLPYDVRQEDLEADFAPFGGLEEVHVPIDNKTGSAKGFAYIKFADPDAAERAFSEKDGETFQGRLLHILPAAPKRESKLDDFALSKLPIKKQQQIKRRREAASTTFNWNALYMNADAVVSSVADRLGLSKSEVLDPTSSDAAVKQAHAETHIIQETKAYFKQQGVDLDAFKRSQRGDTTILAKNIPYDVSRDELTRLFEEHGDIKRFLMPPSGVIAIVEFANAAQCKAAFGALAYRKLKGSILFLEKAPKDVFSSTFISSDNTTIGADGVIKTSVSDLKDADYAAPDTADTATLFVRNLNFSTTTERLTETFKPLGGFMSARVKTKTDPKKPGQVLSMGFGFLEFRTAQQAQAAVKAMDGYTLDGHKLQIRASHKGADAAEERRKSDAAKKAAGKKTKIIIKNLPFEATKKDVRALFGAYGQLRSVRVPKKMDRAARGFAFADFTTPKEAENAMDALRDTHLLGRRLVLEFAAGEAEDAEAEIEKMQHKVGAQTNKVALQKLTSGGRKKFTTRQDEDE